MKYLLLPIIGVLLASCAPRAAFELKDAHPTVKPGIIAVTRADMERFDRFSGYPSFSMDVSDPTDGFIGRETGSNDIAFGRDWVQFQDGTIWWKCSNPAHPSPEQQLALGAAIAARDARHLAH
jgi:hypothetical protein